MAFRALCIAVLICSLAVGHPAKSDETMPATSQDALSSAMTTTRKLLAGASMMMAPMMAPSMDPMMGPAMAPMMMPAMYNLTLLPSLEVPATMNTMASGMCMLTFTDMAIKYTLTVMDITAVTAAHIHGGAVGANGPVLAFLYKSPMMPPANTTMNGPLTSGMLMSKDFVGPAKNMTVMAFYNKYIASGAAYVNVHTVANPDGEIRAQVNKMAMVTSA